MTPEQINEALKKLKETPEKKVENKSESKNKRQLASSKKEEDSTEEREEIKPSDLEENSLTENEEQTPTKHLSKKGRAFSKSKSKPITRIIKPAQNSHSINLFKEIDISEEIQYINNFLRLENNKLCESMTTYGKNYKELTPEERSLPLKKILEIVLTNINTASGIAEGIASEIKDIDALSENNSYKKQVLIFLKLLRHITLVMDVFKFINKLLENETSEEYLFNKFAAYLIALHHTIEKNMGSLTFNLQGDNVLYLAHGNIYHLLASITAANIGFINDKENSSHHEFITEYKRLFSRNYIDNYLFKNLKTSLPFIVAMISCMQNHDTKNDDEEDDRNLFIKK